MVVHPGRPQRPAREELAIKLALAITSPGVDVPAVLRQQRTESLRALQVYTQHKRRIPSRPNGSELARLLVLDNLIFAAEAEVRWLEHIEQRLLGSPANPSEILDLQHDSTKEPS